MTATISDRLPQFAIIFNMLGNISGNKSNIYEAEKSLIFIKTVASSVSTILSFDNGDTITNPYGIPNTFKDN